MHPEFMVVVNNFIFTINFNLIYLEVSKLLLKFKIQQNLVANVMSILGS